MSNNNNDDDNVDTSTNDNGESASSSTTATNEQGGRPATSQEYEQINGIIEMLRQQNLNVTNIPVNNNSGSAGDAGASAGAGGASAGAGGVAGNLIAENLDLGRIGGGGDDGRKKHAFWDTQPMFLENPSSGNDVQLHAPLIPNKPTSELRQEPYNMPNGFIWSDLDISKPDELNQVYDLLARNYVEDDDCMFRFDYSTDFLNWALTPPHYKSAFHLGVRSSKTQKLVAFISAIPAKIRSYEKEIPTVEINFLCVHKKLRSKRLAPVLIKEITRRVNHSGVFQALYTAGIVLPGPISSCRYYHRSLDAKKLVEVGFTRIPPRMTLARMTKLYRVVKQPSTPNLVPMTTSHLVNAHQLLMEHLKQFELVTLFTLEEFEHWFMPRKGVITTYVACNDPNDSEKVTDMISYYHLHSTIIGNAKHDHLYAAYSFYNIATSVKLVDLMKDALCIAKVEGMDVFNALEQMNNGKFLDELKFGKGDGNLQYYLYNYCCPTLDPKDVGIVLL